MSIVSLSMQIKSPLSVTYLRCQKMSVKSIEISVFGRVQGVWFRKYTQEKAKELGIGGWVKNERDGSVKIHATGETAQLEKFKAWCHRGSPKSHVTEVVVSSTTTKVDADLFVIRSS